MTRLDHVAESGMVAAENMRSLPRDGQPGGADGLPIETLEQVAANTSTEALRSAQNRRSLRCG